MIMQQLLHIVIRNKFVNQETLNNVQAGTAHFIAKAEAATGTVPRPHTRQFGGRLALRLGACQLISDGSPIDPPDLLML